MIKDILVHLDGTDDDAWRLAYTQPIARAFESHVTGLFLNRLFTDAVPLEASYACTEALAHLMSQACLDGDRLEKKLVEMLAGLGLPFELRRIDVAFDEVTQVAIREARGPDLCILMRPYVPKGAPRWLGVVEGILFESGRSVLIVPDRMPNQRGFEQVAIAWNGSREATHAVAEAMPFLTMAREVTAIIADPNPDVMEGDAGSRLARHLGYHGITLQIRTAKATTPHVSDVLLREAEAVGADLMVMGGYGHARLREWVLGGATRDLLHRAPFPLLMAH